MKKLGLVGGTGPESTHMYYRGIIRGVGAALGPEELPRLVIDSLSPFAVFRFCDEADFEGLTAYLLQSINALAAAGAEVAALTAGTTHIVFDELQDRSPIPLVSMIRATKQQLVSDGVSRVAFLGTRFTMVHDFFTGPIEEAGLEVTIPTPADITEVQRRIATELEHGVVTDESRDFFISLVERMRADHGVERVVLGCTELPLVLSDAVSSVPCLDPIPVHIDTLVRAITV